MSNNPERSAAAEHLERVSQLIAAGPDVNAPTKFGRVSKLLRRGVLRATRHATEHNEQLLLELIQAVSALEPTAANAMRQAAGSSQNDLNGLRIELAAANQRLSVLEAVGGIGPETWRIFLERRLSGAKGSGLGPVLDQTVVASTDVGTMMLPAHDRVITIELMESGTWEPAESALIDSMLQPGMAFLDIGAHCGYHAIRGAKRVGPTGSVIALEPSPLNFAYLCANLEANGLSNVLPIPAAGWRETGQLDFALSEFNTGDNNVVTGSPDKGGISVSGLALDDILPNDYRPDLILIDAQGADHLAVQGMEKLVTKVRPPMIVEFWPPGIRALRENPEDAVAYYRSLKYSIKVLEVQTLSEDASLRTIVDAAEENRGEFVTLILRPT